MRISRCAKNLAAVLFILTLIIGSVNAAFAAPTVTLTVLNAQNEFGDINVVRGDSVEVELTVIDPNNESSPMDVIRLVRVSDGKIANEQRRGKELSGSRSLGTQKTTGNDVLGELQVKYISATNGQVLAVSDKNIFLVDNQAVVELTDRTGAVEKEVETVKEKVSLAEAKAEEALIKAAAADTKATDAQSKADILMAKAEELRARADETDNKMLAMKLDQEAAKLERQAIALAAQEAKAAAAAADAKASDAKTKADAADAKAAAADTKASDAQSKADILMAKAEELRARADETDNKMLAMKLDQEAAKLERQAIALAAQEAKAAAAAADTKAADAKTKADAADTKAVDAKLKADAADVKATEAKTNADTALAENADLQNQINNLTAQSCPSGEFVTGIDATGDIICGPSASAAPALSLLAYYPLDGNVLDASVNKHNGAVGGTAAYAAGHTGQAFSFNNATYISTTLDIDPSVQPQLTMGAWVRPSGAFYGQVMTHDDQGFDRSLIYYNGDWRAYDGPAGGSVHTGLLTATGGWQFIAVVYDQDRQTVMLYVDGITVIKAGQLLGPSVNMFRLGNNQSNGAEFFSGLIDEVFVVSGALGVTELDQIRLSGVRSLFP